jgi:pimeloyl-ACP methyl ester carboxylesterase
MAIGHADEVNVVGHDVGTMVAWAYAAAYPDSVRRLTVIEGPRVDEGVYQFPALTPARPGLWNFGFFLLGNGLPERIASGREDTWVAGFVDWLEVVKGGVDPDAIAEYAAQLRLSGHLTASCDRPLRAAGWPADADDPAARRPPYKWPWTLTRPAVLPTMASGR